MKSVSLVLSGGGARGIAHISAIEELEKRGYQIHSIVGTSMGALVGAVYAQGNLEEFKKWLLSLDRMDLIRLVDFSLIQKNGFVKGNRIFKELKHFIPDSKIENLPINYAATATDIINRQEVLFKEGNLIKAIRASIAIPSFFTPVNTGDALLVDGGVLNNLPINHANRIQGDILIAVNVNANIPKEEIIESAPEEIENTNRYQNIISKFNSTLGGFISREKKVDNNINTIAILNTSLEIIRNQLVEYSLEKNPPDILIEVPRHTTNVYDFDKAELLLKVGKESTIRALNHFNEYYPNP